MPSPWWYRQVLESGGRGGTTNDAAVVVRWTDWLTQSWMWERISAEHLSCNLLPFQHLDCVLCPFKKVKKTDLVFCFPHTHTHTAIHLKNHNPCWVWTGLLVPVHSPVWGSWHATSGSVEKYMETRTALLLTVVLWDQTSKEDSQGSYSYTDLSWFLDDSFNPFSRRTRTQEKKIQEIFCDCMLFWNNRSNYKHYSSRVRVV